MKGTPLTIEQKVHCKDSKPLTAMQVIFHPLVKTSVYRAGGNNGRSSLRQGAPFREERLISFLKKKIAKNSSTRSLIIERYLSL